MVNWWMEPMNTITAKYVPWFRWVELTQNISSSYRTIGLKRVRNKRCISKAMRHLYVCVCVRGRECCPLGRLIDICYSNVMQSKRYFHFWSIVRGIQQLPVVSTHKVAVMLSVDVFFAGRLNKLLTKESGRPYFETPQRSYDVIVITIDNFVKLVTLR